MNRREYLLVLIVCLSFSGCFSHVLPGHVLEEGAVLIGEEETIESLRDPDQLKVSPDMGIALIWRIGKESQTLNINGEDNKSYQEILIDTLRFSETGQHYLYCATVPDGTVAVYDGIELGVYRNVLKYEFLSAEGRAVLFAHDGQEALLQFVPGQAVKGDRFAVDLKSLANPQRMYVVERSGQYFLGTRGGEEILAEMSLAGNPAPSPDGKHVLFEAIDRDGYSALVLNGVILHPPQGNPSRVVWREDSREFAYVEYCVDQYPAECQQRAVIGGSIYDKVFEEIKYLQYAPWEKTFFAFAGMADGQWRLATPEGMEHPFDGIRDLKFSDRSENYMYIAKEGDQECLVLDSLAQQRYDEIRDCTFSIDGKRHLYIARKDDKWIPVVDGKEYGQFLRVWDMTLSPDGRHFACAVSTESGYAILSDGEVGPIHDFVASPQFSPDSKHLLYVNFEPSKKTHTLMRDGVPFLVMKEKYFVPNIEEKFFIFISNDCVRYVLFDENAMAFERHETRISVY